MGVARLAAVCSAVCVTACAEIASIDEWPGVTAGVAGAGGHALTGYAVEVQADEPRSYWRLGEQPGEEIAKDVSGPNNGQYIAVSLGEPGAIEGDTAARFDGQSARLLLDDIYDFEGTSEFSLEAWIAPSKVDSISRRVFDKLEFLAGGSLGGYALYVLDGKLVFERANESVESVDAPIQTGAFSHVVATYGNSTMRLYVNGQPGPEVPAALTLPPTNEALVVGNGVAAEIGFVGVLDEVAIYDDALTDAQVARHYAARLPR